MAKTGVKHPKMSEYNRNRKVVYKLKPVMKRLSKYIHPEPNTGCWLWSGTVDAGGYGKSSIKKVGEGAHRIIYKQIKGAIPLGLELDHLCKVRCCVNPQHLEPVSKLENIRRSTIVGKNNKNRNRQKTVCSRGHEYNEENIYRYKLKNGSICRMCRACWRIKALASYYKNKEKPNGQI